MIRLKKIERKSYLHVSNIIEDTGLVFLNSLLSVLTTFLLYGILILGGEENDSYHDSEKSDNNT